MSPDNARQAKAATCGRSFPRSLRAPICVHRFLWQGQTRMGGQGSTLWLEDGRTPPSCPPAPRPHRPALTLPTEGNPMRATRASPDFITSKPSPLDEADLEGSRSCARYLASFAFSRPRWYSVAMGGEADREGWSGVPSPGRPAWGGQRRGERATHQGQQA